MRLKRNYGAFSYYLTVNAFTAWIGNILRNLSVINKTIFWVWDYYPPGYPNWKIKLARWVYWKFDTWSTTSSSSLVFLNRRLATLRRDIGVLPKRISYSIVPIGTNPGKVLLKKKKIIGHFGVLKRSQGLDLLFDTFGEIRKHYPSITVEVIGSGPDYDYFKKRSKNFPHIIFHGYIKQENDIDAIIRNWSVGIATYIPEDSNPSYWTDPSKIKAYLSQGVPVITTSITTMSEELASHKAGIIIDYTRPEEFVNGVVKILKNQSFYKKRAHKLAEKYTYSTIYPGLFK